MEIKKELDKLGLSEEQYENCLKLIIDKRNGLSDMDWAEIRDLFNLPYNSDTLRKANGTVFGGTFVYEYFKQKEDKNIENVSDILNSEKEVSINKDGTYLSKRLLAMNEKQCKDTSFILKAHGFDCGSWKIVSLRNNIRQVISKQDGVITLYASFLTVKPTTDLTLEQIKSFYEELKQKEYKPVTKIISSTLEGYMLEIPIQDVHFGKLSRTEDVTEPYNFNLARERFNYVVDDVLKSVSGFHIEKIIFPIGNDFFHVDTNSNTTTSGTKLDSDLSPQLIFKYGLDCLIENIIKLSKLAPVTVFCINGNHDWLTSYHAICALDCYFAGFSNVTVDTSTYPRKYIEFGKVLLSFTHGDKEKNRIEGLMQVEAAEAWGRTKFREIHCGHLHSEQVREVNGITIRHLPSFTGTDLWHRDYGYVGAIKRIQSFLWDKDRGLKQIIVTSVD